jgi:hypothetical protein
MGFGAFYMIALWGVLGLTRNDKEQRYVCMSFMNQSREQELQAACKQ